MSGPRTCARTNCANPLVQRYRESASRFAARMCCSPQCALLHRRDKGRERVAEFVAMFKNGATIDEIAERECVTANHVERTLRGLAEELPLPLNHQCRGCGKPLAPGRVNGGKCHKCRKLRDHQRREEQHRQIRELRLKGLTDREIAARLKISDSKMSYIVNVEMNEGKSNRVLIDAEVPGRIVAMRKQLPKCEIELMMRLRNEMLQRGEQWA